jgi:hypothetical protein
MPQFQAGQSGNPNGRPAGSRNKGTMVIEKLLAEGAEEIARMAIRRATGGDNAMIKLCFDRLCPPRKDRPIPFAMPEIETARDAAKMAAEILATVAAGDLTPGEATQLLQLFANYVKALEIAERDAGVQRVEDATRKSG